MTQCVVTVDPKVDLDPRTMAFWTKAIDLQSREFADAWKLPYIPCTYMSSDILSKLTDAEVPAFVADTWLMTIQSQLDVPDALGFHDDVAGVIFQRILASGDATPGIMSHEKCETDADAPCDKYAPLSDGKEQALEACDRVEGDGYPIEVDIGGDKMEVMVSNYLLPSAFVPGSPGPWDRMGKLKTWDGMTPGGYEVVRDASGNEQEVFARRVRVGRVGPLGHVNLLAKLQRHDSRLMRRLRGAPLRAAA